MHKQAHNEAGETLIEVLISLIVIGVIIGAYFAAIATTSKATATQRSIVSADAVLRDYAETAKQKVRDFCNGGNTGAPFTVTLNTPIPSGFAVAGTNQTCPAPTSVNTVVITVTMPNGVQKDLSINVRTP